jgi:hypothetical protein
MPPPLILRPPPNIWSSAAEEAIDFAERAVGIVLDPWQRFSVEVALAEGPDGVWAAMEVGLITPRQNGKNFVLEVIQIACIYLFGDEVLVHSAHQFDTSVEHFNRLKFLFENTPELSELLLPSDRSFVTANGKEAIKFNTGQRILFKARSKGKGRGFTGDKVFFDEAYDIPASIMGNMIPTMSTKPMAQVYYTTSALHKTSSVLHAVRKRAEADDPEDRLAWLEWGNNEEDVPDDDDPDGQWEAIDRANPAIRAGRISVPYIMQEIRTFSGDPELVEEHRRERYGIPEFPDELDVDRPIPMALWNSLAQESSIEEDRRWALAVSLNRRWAAIALAGRRADDKYHVEWMEHREGTAWVVDRAVKARENGLDIPLRVHKQGAEASLIKALDKAGIEVEEVSTTDYARATGEMIDAADSRNLVHLGQRSLDRALESAILSQTDTGASVWSEKKSGDDISTLKAVTVALGGVLDATDEFFVY